MGKIAYDFSGWATVHNVRCSDGRTIRGGAFKECDGKTVPLVWNHNHTSADNVLGHALLEQREQGVYAYCSFNNNPEALKAKEQIMHKDITALSIYANKLQQNGNDVIHGVIREVSLVLAGANPGAYIDNVVMHSDGADLEIAVIYNEEELNLEHGEIDVVDENGGQENMDENKNVQPNSSEENKDPNNAAVEHGEEKPAEKTAEQIFDTMSEEQKNVCYALTEAAYQKGVDEATKANNGGKENMSHNAFENNENKNEVTVLSHSDLEGIIGEAKNTFGSMRKAFENYALQHSITNVENLFPEVHNVTNQPKVVDHEPKGWITAVMNGVKHVPFSRIKSTYATLTADEARAKGYVKGSLKVEEVLSAAKRTTNPTTVYKLQKMDRDDVIDITDFDVIAWIKGEMKGKLQEELARAILFGDGRTSSDDHKIDEQCIRPIVSDSSVYTIQHSLSVDASDLNLLAGDLIDQSVIAMEDYKGSGVPSAFVRRDIVSRMLLLKDVNGRRIYANLKEIATAMLVKEIVPVTTAIMGNNVALLVDLTDYYVGANKPTTMFDDFDINYNKMEYLIETRCCGANVTPYSAINFVPAVVANSNKAK